MSAIFNRKKEKKKLEEVLKSPSPEFIAVYGRRRVGKTHLIRNFFHDKGIYFEMTGAKRAPQMEQLVNFKNAFTSVFPNQRMAETPSNWTEALFTLKEAVETIPKTEKVILFFDEAPWIETPKSGFLSALEHLWNRYLSEMKHVILILCGSSASWMIEKIVDNRGGLYGRLTKVIHLLPFKLGQTEHFLQAMGVTWDRQQIVDFYLAVGGIAKYLSFVNKSWSAAQATQNLIFDPQGMMHDEFDRLFASLFDQDERHIKVVKILAEKRKGLTQNEIVEKGGLSAGGNTSRVIKELEKSGFISFIPPFRGGKKGGLYKLSDEFSLFYLHWVISLKKRSLTEGQENYWLHRQNSKSWLSWAGFAFEAVCLKHLAQIKKALGISGVITYQTGWRSTNSPGAEIDLVIEREDKCINLCEIKYSHNEFQIDKAYAEKMRQKRQRFIQETGIRKAVFITFITPYGIKENAYSRELVNRSVTLDALFDDA
ncbi:MAG: AAA family ATPase [Chlamydiia bacterium]|nr:AAA family ATPase [Chlamydiia bacterium]